jgi:hypothetical protein
LSWLVEMELPRATAAAAQDRLEGEESGQGVKKGETVPVESAQPKGITGSLKRGAPLEDGWHAEMERPAKSSKPVYKPPPTTTTHHPAAVSAQ